MFNFKKKNWERERENIGRKISDRKARCALNSLPRREDGDQSEVGDERVTRVKSHGGYGCWTVGSLKSVSGGSGRTGPK